MQIIRVDLAPHKPFSDLKLLKNYLGFVLLIMTIVFNSCGNSDQIIPNNPEVLLGQWSVKTQENYNCPNTGDNYVIECTSMSTEEECLYLYEFLADNEFNFIAADGSKIPGTYNIEGADNDIVSIVTQTQSFSGVYSVSGDILRIFNSATNSSCGLRIILTKQ